MDLVIREKHDKEIRKAREASFVRALIQTSSYFHVEDITNFIRVKCRAIYRCPPPLPTHPLFVARYIRIYIE